MSPNDRLERMLVELLAEDTPSRPPDRLVPETLRALRHARRRPRWFALMKEPPMRYSSRIAVGSPTARLLTITMLSLLLLIATLGAVVAGARVLSAESVPPPFGPARNGSIAFARDGDIYLADADGLSERPIITGPTDDVGPWFSRSGTELAFIREGDGTVTLMLAGANGEEPRAMIDGVEWLEFSPSDAEMVVIREVDGTRVMSVVDVATAEARDLDLDGIEPFWWAYPRPPDGREIVFVGYPVPGEPAVGIYGIGMDNTGLRTIGEISIDESPRTALSPSRWSFQDASLSPDGQTIAFWNFEPADGAAGDGQGFVPSRAYLHLRDLESGAELPIPFDTNDDEGYLPRFLPDGNGIVFEDKSVAENGQAANQLFLGRLDGSGSTVPVGPAYDFVSQRTWDLSPDGTKVFVSFTIAGNTSIVDITSGDTIEAPVVGDGWSWQRLAP